MALPLLFYTQEGQTAEGICPKPAQIPVHLLNPIILPALTLMRVEEGTDRSTEIIIWLMLPLGAPDLF